MAAGLMAGCHSSNNTTMTGTNNELSNRERSDGWELLFDGKGINQWHTYGKTGVGAAWKAQDGALYFDPAVRRSTSGSGGDIVTNKEYENFHLKLEWKVAPGANSGVIFYVQEDPAKFPNTYNSGPEMQVLDNELHADAKIIKHRAGDLYDLISVSKETVRPAGQWNQAEIISNKGKLDFHLNGEHVLSTTMWNDAWRQMIAGSKFKSMPGFGTFTRGRIALQDHGDAVWFRNIRIKEL
jgi:hypothetical protein